MQRVRIGLTGLAFVFVLVLLAAVFTSPSNEEPITANSIERQIRGGAAGSASAEAEPKEPLAELGVAPGNADSNDSQQAGAAGAK
jgi:Tfp pilus assembly protein PilX